MLFEVLSLLLRFGDAKDDNYRLDGTRIVGIDNESVFANRIIANWDNSHILEAKDTLFLIDDLMRKPIHPAVTRKILDCAPEEFLFTWLQMCDLQNTCYGNTYLGLSCTAERCPSLVQFPPDIVILLKTELYRIKQKLLSDQSCTHQDILAHLCPIEAQFYAALRRKYPNPRVAQSVLWGSGDCTIEAILWNVNFLYLSQFTARAGDSEFRDASTGKISPPSRPSDEMATLLKSTDLFAVSINFRSKFIDAGLGIPQAGMAEFHPSWRDFDILLLALESCSSSSIMKLLDIDHKDLIITRNNEGANVLHQAAKGVFNYKVFQKLVALIPSDKLSSTLNIADIKQLTPLDYAMEQTDPSCFISLIDLGAYKCSDLIALKFYQKSRTLATMGNAFRELMQRNPAVEWVVALEEMLPPSMVHSNTF